MILEFNIACYVVDCLFGRLCYVIIERTLWVGREPVELRLALIFVVGAFIDALARGGCSLLIAGLFLGRR